MFLGKEQSQQVKFESKQEIIPPSIDNIPACQESQEQLQPQSVMFVKEPTQKGPSKFFTKKNNKKIREKKSPDKCQEEKINRVAENVE